MSKDIRSYELLHRGLDYDQEADPGAQRPLNVESPLTDQKTIPHSNTTTAFDVNPDANEKPDIALKRSIIPLLISFLVHIIPTISTISVVQLSIFKVYWFDSDPESELIPWKRVKVSLNELLNLLQFVAKIHEILLVGSLAAMVMHRVRVRLLGKHGLPFGMVVGGYNVGSAEYLLSAAFRSGFNRRFWPLSLLIFAFTLLANTLGPASAIALVPNLDWWDMKKPFGGESLPLVFNITKDQWWPLEITKEHTILADEPQEACFSSLAFERNQCPASGFNELVSWTASNAFGAIEANVTLDDGLSPAQRRVKSRLTDRHDNIPGVAITTSLSHSVMTMIGSFWEQVGARDYPVNDVIRPQLGLSKEQISFQPLVQVQCIPNLLEHIHELAGKQDSTVGDNYDLNTFSTNAAPSLPIPNWLSDYKYNPPNKLFLDSSGQIVAPVHEATNISWLESPSKDGSSLSLAAIVTTPMVLGDISDTANSTQTAFVHFCSVDARWIASQPTYDPTEHLVIANNVTDPLVFQRPKDANEDHFKRDMSKWGISPPLKLSMDWVKAINIPAEYNNISAPAIQWLLGQYIVPYSNITNETASEDKVSVGEPQSYIFNPGNNGVKNATQFVNLDANDFAMSTSETVATVLGLQITDALARIRLYDVQGGEMIMNTVNDTHVNVAYIGGALAGLAAVQTYNISKDEIAGFPTKYTFGVQRYGYGYGFSTGTVYFGVTVLLSHSLLTIIYIVYATYDYFFVSRYTSSAWGDVGEFAALLINSKPTIELQNTCAGIDSKHTWRKRIRIRETGDCHLGVVVGDEGYLASRPVKVDKQYGTLDTNAREGGLRKRRGSI